MSNEQKSQSVEIEFEINEKICKVNFERVVEISFDPNYGADGDGRRGVPRYSIESDKCEDVMVDDIALESYPVEFRNLIEIALEDYQAKNDFSG